MDMNKVLTIGGRKVILDKEKEKIIIDGVEVSKKDFEIAEGKILSKNNTKFKDLLKAKEDMILDLENKKATSKNDLELEDLNKAIQDIKDAYDFSLLGEDYFPSNLSLKRLNRMTELHKLFSKTNFSLMKNRKRGVVPVEMVYTSLKDVFGEEYSLDVINKFIINYCFMLRKRNTKGNQFISTSLFILSKVGISRIKNISQDGLISEENHKFAIEMKNEIKKVLDLKFV